MTATVAGIFIAPGSGQPLVAVPRATLEKGRGIVGDRYHAGDGTFSEELRGKPDFEVTLIEAEEIERFNARQKLTLPLGAFRRNIATRGIRLNELVGRRFSIGGVVLEGVRLCEPCAYLAQVVTPEVLPGLVHRAGLRACIVSGGEVCEGDLIEAQTAI